MKDFGEKLQPGGAALFVLVHPSTPDKVLPRISSTAARSSTLARRPRPRRPSRRRCASRRRPRAKQHHAGASIGGLVAALRFDRDPVADQLGQRRGHRRPADARLLRDVAGGLGLILDRLEDETAVLPGGRAAGSSRRRRGAGRPCWRRRAPAAARLARLDRLQPRDRRAQFSASSASGAISASAPPGGASTPSTASRMTDIAPHLVQLCVNPPGPDPICYLHGQSGWRVRCAPRPLDACYSAE